MNTVAHPRIERPAAEPWIPNRQDSFAASGTSLTQHPAAAGRAEESSTPRASRESSSSFRRISANAGPPREALTHDPPNHPLDKQKKLTAIHLPSPIPMGYRTHQRSRDGPKRAVESEQTHPSRAARKLFLLPKNLCERRSAPRHAHPRPRLIIPSINPFEKPT